MAEPSNREIAAEVADSLTVEQHEPSHRAHPMDKFLDAAHWIPRAISPFLNLDCIFDAALAGPDDLPLDYEKNIIIYKKILTIYSGFSDLLSAFQAKDEAGIAGLAKFIAQVTHVMRESRSQDTNTVKTCILSYLPANPETETITPNIVGGEKYKRGWNHPWTARALCPLKYIERFDHDPTAFMKHVQQGKAKLRAKDFPSFLYPHGSTFDELQPDLGLFRGHVLVRTLRLIYTGESSIFSGHRSAPRACQAEIHDMREVTPEAVAYAACQAYVNLSSLSQWSNIDNYFDLEKFHTLIISLFADVEDQWVKETLAFLTSELPSLKRQANKKAPLADDSKADDDNDDPTGILALRVRRAEEERLVTEAGQDENETQMDPVSGEREEGPTDTRNTSPTLPGSLPLPESPLPERAPNLQQHSLPQSAMSSSQRPPAFGSPRINQPNNSASASSSKDGPRVGSEENGENEVPDTRQTSSSKRGRRRTDNGGTGYPRKRRRFV